MIAVVPKAQEEKRVDAKVGFGGSGSGIDVDPSQSRDNLHNGSGFGL
jgi:hypothetical protein